MHRSSALPKTVRIYRIAPQTLAGCGRKKSDCNLCISHNSVISIHIRSRQSPYHKTDNILEIRHIKPSIDVLRII